MAISHHVETLGPLDKILAEIRQVAAHPLRHGGPRLRIVGIKTYLDGGMLTGSAYMREPWGVSKIYAIDDPSYRGVLFIPPERLVPIVRADRRVRACSSRPTASATGPSTPCSTPTKRSTRQTPVAPTRPCITHSNFMSREAIEQAARLGVVVDIQPAWLYLDTRTLAAQFGYDRLRYFQPLHSLFAAGVIAGGGSDHMQKIGSLRSINPYNPFLGDVGRDHPAGQGLRRAAPPRGGPHPRAGDPVLHDQQRPPAVPGGPDRLARGGQAGGLRRHRPRPADVPGGRDQGDARAGDLSRRQTGVRVGD